MATDLRFATPPPAASPGDPTAAHAELATVRLLARLFDNAIPIPGTYFRVGLDAVVGLIPWVGDAIGAVVGSYVLLTAARLGVPRAILARMLVNIGTDAVVGAVPLVGDLFDAAWKANVRNLALLERALAEPAAARRSSTWVLVGLAAVVFAIVGGVAALTALLIRSLT